MSPSSELNENKLVGGGPCVDYDGNSVEIPGLIYYRNFFSEEEQKELLSIVDSQEWRHILCRRQQFYGEVYYHTKHSHIELQPGNTDGLDLNLITPALKKCVGFFGDQGMPKQILVNEYLNNMGIASHFEDPTAFGEIILTASFVNPLYMTLKKPVEPTNACADYTHIVKILLEPGSLLIMKDEARYEYRHGISKYKWVHFPDDRESIHRDASYRRVSITMRHLLPSRRVVTPDQDESHTIKAKDVY